MVTELGMTEALGPVRYANPASTGYLGQIGGLGRTSALKRPGSSTRRRATSSRGRSGTHSSCLSSTVRRWTIADTLQEHEVINAEEIAAIVGSPA